MALRNMPSNIESEQSLLGACFLSKYALQKAGETLLPESFYDEKNGKIYAAMLNLMEDKTPIDLTTTFPLLSIAKTLGLEYEYFKL